jgi:hypothetical protein
MWIKYLRIQNTAFQFGLRSEKKSPQKIFLNKILSDPGLVFNNGVSVSEIPQPPSYVLRPRSSKLQLAINLDRIRARFKIVYKTSLLCNYSSNFSTPEHSAVARENVASNKGDCKVRRGENFAPVFCIRPTKLCHSELGTSFGHRHFMQDLVWSSAISSTSSSLSEGSSS